MTALSSIAESIFDEEFYWKEELKDTRYSSGEEEREKEIVIITDWLEAHLGELNLMINTNFAAENGVVPDLKSEESAILREMYMMNYYRKQGRNLLRTIDGSAASLNFKTIREGDSVITAASIGEKQSVARSYRMLMEDAREKIEKLVHSYNMYQSKPNQVSGNDAN